MAISTASFAMCVTEANALASMAHTVVHLLETLAGGVRSVVMVHRSLVLLGCRIDTFFHILRVSETTLLTFNERFVMDQDDTANSIVNAYKNALSIGNQAIEEANRKLTKIQSYGRTRKLLALVWTAFIGKLDIELRIDQAVSCFEEIDKFIEKLPVLTETLKKYGKKKPEASRDLYIWDFDEYYCEPGKLVEEVLTELNKEEVSTVLVYGPFGYGKSSLVAYVANHHCRPQGMFPGGIFSMQYGKREPEEEQKDLLLRLGISEEDFQALTLSNKILEKLEEMLADHNHKCLLIIDDVWNVLQVPQPSKLPGNQCKLLITSRSDHLLPKISRIKLDAESNKDVATKVLASRAAEKPHETQFPKGCEPIATEILNKCEGCILAVAMIGSVLKQELPEPNAWEKVNADFIEYARISVGIPLNYVRTQTETIYASIGLSINHIKKEVNGKGMRDVLRALAMFKSSTPIPALVVELQWQCIHSKKEGFSALVHALVRKSLLQQTHDGCQTYLKLHTLVADYVEKKLKKVDLAIIFGEEGQLRKLDIEYLSLSLFFLGSSEALRAKAKNRFNLCDKRKAYAVICELIDPEMGNLQVLYDNGKDLGTICQERDLSFMGRTNWDRARSLATLMSCFEIRVSLTKYMHRSYNQTSTSYIVAQEEDNDGLVSITYKD